MDIDHSILQDRFGISYLRPYQELIIRYILEHSTGKGRLLGILPTGSGKSLCFMYPASMPERKTILIYPLLALMNDQAERFRKAGIPCTILRGGLGSEERKKRIKEIRGRNDGAVITNIETLIAMKERGELRSISKGTDLIVIDEAHTVVTWGKSFRSAYLSLPEVLEEIGARITLAFTATVDREILDGINKYVFAGEKPYTVHASADRENIFYHSVRSLSKLRDVRKILSAPSSRPAIIFCRSRELTEHTAAELAGSFDIRHYHAALGKEEKEEKERWFMASESGVLAATTAYGLGMDKPDIRTVIHLSLPDDVTEFMQEAGRGGRDGGRMDSFVLYYASEHSGAEHVFRGEKCIRTALLSHMGEEREERMCLACSSCVPDGYTAAGETEILSFISRHPLITERSAAAAMTSGHIFMRRTRLPDWREEEVRKAIAVLCGEGAIRKMGTHLIARRQNASKRSETVPLSHPRC